MVLDLYSLLFGPRIPRIATVHFCVSGIELAWDLVCFLSAIPNVVTIIFLFKVFYFNSGRAYGNFLIAFVVSIFAMILQACIPWVRPYPQCVIRGNIIVEPSINGFPDSNLAYLVSLVVILLYFYGFELQKISKRRFKRLTDDDHVRLFVIVILLILGLSWLFWHAWQLTILQVLATDAYAIGVTIGLIEFKMYLITCWYGYKKLE
jgi:hypothetical protein